MTEPSARRSRLASWGWDYLVVLAWLAVVFAAVGVPQLLGWIDLSAIWSDPVAADVAVTGLTVVPYLTYLVATEAGPARASWGKRRSGLAVAVPEGGAAWGRVVVRNTIKVLPWQLGHMAALRFASAQDFTWFAVVLYAGSLLTLAAIVVPVLLGRRGLHDLAAGTDVAR